MRSEDALILEAVAFGKSQSTRSAVFKSVGRFLKWSGKSLSEVDEGDVVRYLVSELKGKKEAARILLTYLSAALRRVGRVELAARVAEMKRGLRVADAERRRGFLTDEELERVASLLRELASRPPGTASGDCAAAMLLMLETGLRPGEALSLKSSDVSFHSGHATITVRGKGGRVVVKRVYDPLLVEALSARARVGGRLFKVSDRTLRRRFKQILLQAGLPARRVQQLRPHDLRRTAALLAYRETRDLEGVRVWLGHSKPETTTIYLGRGILQVEEERYREISTILSERLQAGRGARKASPSSRARR
ncbi:MAG: tyrosine-type recombinase/integrase [Thermofilaceae archaeon]